jgi:hypothetical protein
MFLNVFVDVLQCFMIVFGNIRQAFTTKAGLRQQNHHKYGQNYNNSPQR